MTTNIFETKKQYLQFRAAWANAVNSPRAKHWRTPGTIWVVDDPKRVWIGHDEVQGWQRHSGWITNAHVVLYNVIRKKPVTHGFTPITNPAKIKSNKYPMRGCWTAVMELKYYVDKAKSLVKIQESLKSGEKNVISDYVGRPPIKPDDRKRFVEQSTIDRISKPLGEFLEPFGRTFTIQHLANLEIPDYRIDGTYGRQVP